IDDLILRDRSTANNGTINERRYAMQDGNWNTVAICDITGSVGERFAYSAYGSPVFMNGTGTVQSASAIGFETLYAGYRFDGTTPQMYYVRNRILLPMVGTWNRRDSLGYLDSLSLFEYAVSNTVVMVDPSGLRINAPPPQGVRSTSQHRNVRVRQNGVREPSRNTPRSSTHPRTDANEPYYGNYGPDDPWGIIYWSEYINGPPPPRRPGSGPRHQGPTYIGSPPKPLVLTQPKMAPVGSIPGGASSCNATSTLAEPARRRIPPNWQPPGWVPTESNGRCWCCEVLGETAWSDTVVVFNCRRELPVDCLLREYPNSRCLPDFILEGTYDISVDRQLKAFEWDPQVPRPRLKGG
ncbi:MAG: hypothetical protein NTX48_06735, partial [Planctomycetales bacterium]|nr:hypothetical protein [Planctomycetales bacterium]